MKLSYYSYPLDLWHTFTVSSFSRTCTPGVQVEIEWEGIVGYGEASMPPYLGESLSTVFDFLKKVDLSSFKDPFQLEEILSYIDQLMPGNTAAKASLDIALHDLVGKLLNAPWYKIWGLNPRNTPFTTYTIGIDTIEKIKEKTTEVVNEFRILEVKLESEKDKEIIKAIRSVSSLPLVVDANQGWKDKYEALDMMQWLKEQGTLLIEQPMPKEAIEDIAWLTAHTILPVYADESIQRLKDIEKIKGAFNGINIKLMKCTGMREAMKMMTMAKALGMGVMVGCMTETSCAISAAAHLAPLADFADLDGNLLIANDLFEGMKIKNGKITLNELPGIGVQKRINY